MGDGVVGAQAQSASFKLSKPHVWHNTQVCDA